ncbi:hypothetical protein [Stenotrophomonas sp. SrG]|uniref:hypothetical protein n=1 Tax=Stenotrophomonas sp. SrG TaxID=3414430 RepID=UPI003CEEC172
MTSKDDETPERLPDAAATRKNAELGPWRRFGNLIVEPWTLILLLVSVFLFVIGQKTLDPSVSALVQILLAVSSGVLGARVTNQLETASGKSILEARGKVAVRGLKLMLVQTAAFQRRLGQFLANRVHILQHPEVTERNYEEAIEFCRRIQEEAASAMETWGDIVPTADLSSLIGRITEAEDQRDALQESLELARAQLVDSAGNAEEAARLREVVQTLEEQAKNSDRRVNNLLHNLGYAHLNDAAAGTRAAENLGFPTKGVMKIGGVIGRNNIGGALGRTASNNPNLDK